MDWFPGLNSLVKSHRKPKIHHVFLSQAGLKAGFFDLGSKGFEELGGVLVSGGCHSRTIRTLAQLDHGPNVP